MLSIVFHHWSKKRSLSLPNADVDGANLSDNELCITAERRTHEVQKPVKKYYDHNEYEIEINEPVVLREDIKEIGLKAGISGTVAEVVEKGKKYKVSFPSAESSPNFIFKHEQLWPSLHYRHKHISYREVDGTLYIVESVSSPDAKETIEEKTKRFVVNHVLEDLKKERNTP